MSPERMAEWGQNGPERLEGRIVIERDGTVTVLSGKVEYGQGIRTGFGKIVAEELDVPLNRVRVVLGDTRSVPWDMGTFGSLSTATDGHQIRRAAAYARALLLKRGEQRLGAGAGRLKTRSGKVVAPDGRSVSYEELTSDSPLAGEIPESDFTFRITGTAEDRPLRMEALDIVTGRIRYPADIRLPGMLRAYVLHPPRMSARLEKCNAGAAEKLPGVVKVVVEGNFVGVVAEKFEQALAATRALQVKWRLEKSVNRRKTEVSLRKDPGLKKAFTHASRILHSFFEIPHIAHALISPSAAVADVEDTRANIYAASQRPFGLREEAAELLGMPIERVCVVPQAMGGMFGRGNVNDAALEAVQLSRAVKRPVLVQWTREDEFRFSPHRPFLKVDVSATLDGKGEISGWRYSSLTNPQTYGGDFSSARLIEMTAGRNAVPPYRLGKGDILLKVVPGEIRTGAFRSLAAAPHVFAIESFMDEISHAAGRDPIAYRLTLIRDPRLKKVLEAVRQMSGWTGRKRGGAGFGAACAIYNGTYIAEIAEVSVDEHFKITLERVWCAVDAGRLVHPDGARNQIEGGIQQAASWALIEELRHQDGKVIDETWYDYPIATANDAPREIQVEFISDPDRPPSGTGEPGSVPTAAAIANAVYDACGVRIRKLPLTPNAVALAKK